MPKHDELPLLINNAESLAHHSGDMQGDPDCDHESPTAIVTEYLDAAVRILEWSLNNPGEWLSDRAFVASMNSPGCCSEMMSHVAGQLVERGTLEQRRCGGQIAYRAAE